jgi:N6-L-threonylcarbamoyladenine synthase
MKKILGIETSCDDTSICILETSTNADWKNTKSKDINILFHEAYSHIENLKEWGGIVPEIVARNHHDKLYTLFNFALEKSNIKPNQLDLIGVTTHPGLVGPLLTGINLAKSISFMTGTPIVAVNHIYAHIEAIHLSADITYPYLFCLVSGGHTLFGKVDSPNQISIHASTIDDAAGEAFDKGGKLLELGYPAGYLIDRYSKWGDANSHKFPIGLIRDKSNFNTSFSGLKNAIRIESEKLQSREKEAFELHDQFKHPNNELKKLYDLCASYQKAIVRSLTEKFSLFCQSDKEFNTLPIVLCGGVARNTLLRNEFSRIFKNVHLTHPEFSTDNGAMIANYAFRTQELKLSIPESLQIDAIGNKTKDKFN